MRRCSVAPLPDVWHFGIFKMHDKDFELSEDTFQLCGTLLERLAYRLLAMELNAALEQKFGTWIQRRNHPNEFIRNASIVVWMIRNAVAHGVIDPVWKIDDPTLQNQIFSIPGLMEFDTGGLNGRQLKRLDFGGPIALLKLSEQMLPLLR